MIKSWKAGLVLAFLALGIYSCSFARPLPVGSSAPDFTLPSLETPSRQVSLSEINRDNPVLLVFWATWCPNCQEEIPQLNELYQKKSAQGLKILAVNVEEKRAGVEEFIKKHPISYPVLLDEKGITPGLYGLSGIPVIVYLEKGGKILYYGFELPGHIDQLLEQRRS